MFKAPQRLNTSVLCHPLLTASPANGLKGPTDDSPAAANPFSSDDVAPSMISPMLVRFAVDEELTLPWAVSGAPGLAPHGPMDSPFGLRKKSGPSKVGAEAEDRSEATECLPASPRSPLCFFSGEATDLPASPRTPSSSPPIPEFSLLVTPPLCSQAPVKPLLVYSRRRFHHSRTPVGGEAAAAAVIPSPASLVGDVVAVTAAPPLAITLGDPATSTVTTPPAAATVPPAAATMLLLPVAVAPPAAAHGPSSGGRGRAFLFGS
ncbi:leucine-rich repeat extensin-like protein 5 [Miscanthus floridulus]|uniref:leucine-rich repeat extensin-like protein 5 n=1 Tax=Miscanthus floridulus TaxID=154761 RepID=UPI003459EF98